VEAPAPTSGEWLLIGTTEVMRAARFVLWCDPNSSAPGIPDGSIARPFKTLQDALNEVVADAPHPTLMGYTINLMGGDFQDEDLDYSPTTEKNLVINAYSEVIMKLLTWNVPAAGGTLALQSLNQVERSPDTRRPAITFIPQTTNIRINSDTSLVTRPTLSLVNVEGNPTLDATFLGPRLSVVSSQIGKIARALVLAAGSGFNLDYAYNSAFTNANIYQYGLIDSCFFVGPTTTFQSATLSFGARPFGFFQTVFQAASTVEGPATVIACDQVTNYFLNINPVLASGGATSRSLEQEFSPAIAAHTWP
jgi:hypothetical protein